MPESKGGYWEWHKQCVKHVVILPCVEEAHMNRDNGRPKSAIWLLADSPPLVHADKLDDPLDSRFPTRHNIWTPIETIMNRELFLLQKSRIDDRKFFIRNAVKSPEDWKHKNKHILAADIADFKRLVDEHQPFMILTFGQRAFEFACRSQGENAQPFSYWEVAKLSGEFDARLSCIRDGKGYYYLRAGDTLNLVTHVATLLPHAPDPWDNPAKLAAGRAGFVCGVLRITAGHEHGDHREGRSIGEPTGAAAEGPVVRQVGGEFAVKVARLRRTPQPELLPIPSAPS